MKRYVRFTLCVFLLLIFTANAQATKVTIHGKGYDGKGDDATLSQIDDIVRFVTGSTPGEFTFKKDSLMLINSWKPDESHVATHPRIFQFNSEGEYTEVADTSNHWEKGHYYFTPNDYNQMPGDVLSTRGKDGKFYALQNDEQIFLRITTWDGKELDGSVWTDLGTGNLFGHYGTMNDIKAGMTVPGFDGEIVAFCSRPILDGKANRMYVNFAEVHADDSELGISIKAITPEWSDLIAQDGKVPQMYDGVQYCPVKMAVGDYNGDGYTNEFVVVWSDTAAVYYTVRQLNYDSSGFSLTRLDGGNVFTYDSPTNHLDGIARTLSCSVVTGDFDGDGTDEFAVVVLDTSKLGGDCATYDNTKPIADANELAPVHNIVLGEWTGKIHIFVHKWNDGGFDVTTRLGDSLYECKELSKETHKYYGYWGISGGEWYISFPVGVKAAVGDFNGDGRDDIAVLRVMINYTEHYSQDEELIDKNQVSSVNDLWLDIKDMHYGAAVDLYTFDTGSTMPHYFPRAGHVHTSIPDFATYDTDLKIDRDVGPIPKYWYIELQGRAGWYKRENVDWAPFYTSRYTSGYYDSHNQWVWTYQARWWGGEKYDVPYHGEDRGYVPRTHHRREQVLPCNRPRVGPHRRKVLRHIR